MFSPATTVLPLTLSRPALRFGDFIVTIKMPDEIINNPAASVSVRCSPRNTTDISRPMTGTPSIAVDMLVLDSHMLAAFTATKQHAVPNGPMNNSVSINDAEPSPSYGPSTTRAITISGTLASNICHGASW